MGIALGALHFLLAEGAVNPWRGRLLTLGKQGVSVTAEELQDHAATARYALRMASASTKQRPDLTSEPQRLSDEQFFGALGFAAVDAMDISGYEGAELIHDLNDDRLSSDWLGRYDAVLDGGTVEHVFDVRTAMRNVCRMTKVGGRIVHISPMANCVDHGFYSFSPTFFVDYYAANSWRICRTVYARFRSDPVHDKWELTDYTPGCFPALGVLDDATYFLLVCVQRLEISRDDIVPQQSYFRERVWDRSNRQSDLDEER